MKELIAATLNRAASADEQQARKFKAFTAFNDSLKSILDPDQLEKAKELLSVK